MKTQSEDSDDENKVKKFTYSVSKDGRSDKGRYALKFYRESNAEIKARKEEAYKTLEPVPEKELEIKSEEFFPIEMGFPKRPSWSYDLSVAALEAREIKYFNV